MELALCEMAGNHLIVARRGTCDALLQADLNGIQQAIVHGWRNAYTQHAALVNTVSRYVSIVIANGSAMPAEVEVTVTKVIDGILRMPTVLVSENDARDGRFFEILIQAIRRKRSHPSTSMYLDNGGGAATVQRARYWTSRDALVAAVVDSDRKSPNWPLGITARRLLKDLATYEYGRTFVLPAHEIENLVPLSVLQLLDEWQSCGAQGLLIRMGDEFVAGQCDLWAFFDFKSGLSEVLITSISDRGDYNWVNDRLQKYGIDEIPSVGNDLISSVVHSNNAIAELVRSIVYWPQHWRDFLYELEDWFISAPRKIAI